MQLDLSPNTLIIGTNGSGKSTLLDALCFVLFNKPFRKIAKPGVVNSINQSNCLVEVGFTIGTKVYKISRGIKPNIFEIHCNGILINQDAQTKDYQEHLEKSILKLNFKSFTQVVILGSASFVPFMQLSPMDRRAVIEDLLDIQVFSVMNALVKTHLSNIKDNKAAIQHDIDLNSQLISVQEHNIEEHKKHTEVVVKKKQQEVEDDIKRIDNLEKDIVLIQRHIDTLQKTISDKLSLENRNKKLLQLESKLESKIKKVGKDVSFYEENDSCPTCQQEIDKVFKETQIKERKKNQLLFEEGIKSVSDHISKVNVRFLEIQKVQNNISQHSNEVVKHNSTITAINNYIKKVNQEITELNKRSQDSGDMDLLLKNYRNELQNAIQKQENLSVDKHYYEHALLLLKDTGIKTQIIKQYLPIMNKLINKYLSAMDFFVNFNISDNFEETIKSRFRDTFTYESFSEGEKMRIDLSLLMAWRQVAKLKNSTNTNLLILDEVFDSSLDAVGTDEFLKLIHSMGPETNVFVISHKGDILFDKFKSVIKFIKKNNFSQLERENNHATN